ncbi:MAG: hypothetical protein BWY83_02889 [bacterium ADurb.Bin478]|nr:MAG: hypothetical protein BWY83_02889 [bacterium ADurb.Bin478]
MAKTPRALTSTCELTLPKVLSITATDTRAPPNPPMAVSMASTATHLEFCIIETGI